MGSDYKVGHKKPPKEHQFEKGVSGNPTGRRPLDKNRVATKEDRRNIILKEANKIIKIRTAEGSESVSMFEALVKRIFQESLSGDKRSQKLLICLLEKSFEEGTEKLRGRKEEVNRIMDALEIISPGLFGTEKPDPNELFARLLKLMNSDIDEDPESTVTVHIKEIFPKK